MAGPTGQPNALSAADGAALVRLAALAVRARLIGVDIDGRAPGSRPLRAVGASFVTLSREGALRGCIGTLDPARPLYRDVTANAVRAMADPRMEPVTAAEWAKLDLTVTVLSPAQPVAASTLDELYAAVRPHHDGLILTDGRRRSTFLPAVWEKLPDPVDFVTALLQKGGWPSEAGLPAGVTGTRYQAVEYRDPGPRAPL